MAILDVVKFDGFGDRKWLIYHYPGNEFNSKSKFIVGPGQIGLVVHGGKIEEIYESGTYTLNSENLPFLKGFVKGVYGKQVPYTLELYYVNKIIKLDMLWGTKDPIPLLDPKFKVKINVRARGQYALRIKNYQFLLTNLIGALAEKNVVTFSAVADFFRAIINTRIKTNISEYFIKDQVSILDVTMYLEKISEESFEDLKDDFDKYGMELVNFFFESINIPEEDLKNINEILNKNAAFEIMGDERYRTSRGYDVLESAAQNESSGGIAATGIGLGVGLGMGQAVGSMAKDIIPEAKKANTDGKFCVHCGAKMSKTSKFCPECGEKVGD
jgi:membrane protease subunit (stomatin/prohibitin family)